jgi:hypothetical protein
VLRFLSSNFAWDSTVPAGTLELIKANGETVECTLILMSEWETILPSYPKVRLVGRGKNLQPERAPVRVFPTTPAALA